MLALPLERNTDGKKLEFCSAHNKHTVQKLATRMIRLPVIREMHQMCVKIC